MSGHVRSQIAIGAVDVVMGPWCSIVASSTAGIVNVATLPISRRAPSHGTKIVACPRLMGEEFVGEDAARRAGGRHALGGQCGAQLTERSFIPGERVPDIDDFHDCRR